MSNEELRNKKILEGMHALTIEERAKLCDWKPAITKEVREQLRVLESKSTPVVAWYAHTDEVRGPFGRWLTCSNVSPEYQKHVAWKNDECAFAAAAMNNLLSLLDALDNLEAENTKLRKALAHKGSCDCGPGYENFRCVACTTLEELRSK